ncbi:hypothetical protein QL285_039872 [Trifolium repens]|nr:hypothetical protein QL285_039872 [Trifolium repens]
MTEGYFRSYLLNTEKHKYELTPFPYQNSISSTKEFQDWWERHYSASISSGDALFAQVSSGFKSSLLEHVKATVARGHKAKAASTSSQQSVSLPVKEATKGSKRASSSVAEKLPKKLKKNPIDLTEIDKQNINADLGRVIAKVSSQILLSSSVQDTDKKKKKKETRQSEGHDTEPHNDAIPSAPVGASDVVEDPEKSKDKKKKKKKLRKAHSKSTTTISDNSIPGRQPGEPQGANNTTQDPLQEKIPEQHNESSNSCPQPPPVKTPASTLPEIFEGSQSHKVPAVEHMLKGDGPEEKSTADSPSKGSFEGAQQDPPQIETNDQMDEDLLQGKDAAVEGGPVEQTQEEPTLGQQNRPTQQDPKATSTEALEKLLSGDSFNTNSEGTSAPTQDEETARLDQANLEAKFIEDFLQRDVLEVIDNDPHAFFGLKALLQQLQTDRTKEAMLFLVNQVEALIEQFAKNQQMLIHAQQSYQAQMQAHASALADATVCNAEVSNLKSGVTAAYLKTAACEENIARWRAEIRELETKIAEEERLQEHYFKLATEVTQHKSKLKQMRG